MVQKAVDAGLAGKRSPVILDAGCGCEMPVIRFPGDSHVVGIDICQDQLDRSTFIHERILGDIQDHEFEAGRFDAIVCWDVLEHLRRPERALERFGRALKEGGLIILSSPNPLSTKGIITKVTPYAFHLWFYRNVRGWKEAGTEGNPPFPTYLKLSMSPKSIKAFAARNALDVAYEGVVGHGDSIDVLGHREKRVDLVMKALNLFFRIVSVGTIKPEATQYYFVLRKSSRGSA